MSTKLTRAAYARLIAEDLLWLRRQPRTLEREHIEALLGRAVEYEYGHECDGRSPGCRTPVTCQASWENVRREERAAVFTEIREGHFRLRPQEPTRIQQRHRPDGWPLCPNCGRDRLWVVGKEGHALVDRAGVREEAFEGAFHCGHCAWRGRCFPRGHEPSCPVSFWPYVCKDFGSCEWPRCSCSPRVAP